MSNIQSTSASPPMSRQELLTRTGPGTPGGELMRRFWQPVYLGRDLQGTPVSLTILSEDLVLFRDENGEPGLLGRRCAHRNADLSYGRIEDGGLRCPYHGWLFDVKGTCLEQPNVYGGGKPSNLHRQKSYPTIERGGLIWAYMGSGEPPALPDYPFLELDEDHCSVDVCHSSCNYLQGLEGNIDPSHTSFLHYVKTPDSDTEISRRAFEADKAPRISVDETSYGLRVYAERLMPGSDTKVLRISNFVLPNGASADGPTSRLGLGGGSLLWHVPINDVEHLRFGITFHTKKPLPRGARMLGPDELNEVGERKRVLQNRFLQNREALDSSFLGMGPAFAIHDLFVSESMGPITDHGTEHLVSADLAIAHARRMILEAIGDITAGREPKRLISEERLKMHDFLTLTQDIPNDTDIRKYADEVVEQNIYQQAR